MKALIEGFLKFQKEAFLQRTDLFKHFAITLVKSRSELVDHFRALAVFRTNHGRGWRSAFSFG